MYVKHACRHKARVQEKKRGHEDRFFSDVLNECML